MVLGPIAAFAAGLLAFFSPCILPVVPAILGVVAQGTERTRATRLLRTGGFALGFIIAFTIIGFLIGAVGSTSTFQAVEVWLRRVGGVLIIAFGFSMLGLFRLAWMDRDLRFHGKAPKNLGSLGGTLFLGTAFGVGWTPCVGPVLASILVLAGVEGGAAMGAGLLLLFGLGLAIPLLAFAALSDLGGGFLRRYGKASQWVEGISGVFLVLLGIAVFTGAANRLLSTVV